MAKREGTPKTPAEKTLAAAAYAVYVERYRATGDPGIGWARVIDVANGKIRPFYIRHTTEEIHNA